MFGLTSGPHNHLIVNIALTNLRIDHNQNSIHHLPISRLALEKSVIEIDSGSPEIPADLDSFGYLHWLEEFEAGRAGAWEMPIAEIVQSVEDATR